MRLTNVVDELRRDWPWMTVFGVETVTSSAIVPGDAWQDWGPHYAGSGPLGVTVHHDAAGGSWISAVRYEWNKYPRVKATNTQISEFGEVAVLSAGATATNGAGLTLHRFSRGLGGRNSDQWTIEVHNPGTGAKPYPQAQMRSILAVCSTVNRLSGNQRTDVTTHHEIAPDRKTDPAPASSIEGPYNIGPCTSSGTWDADDLRAEAQRFGTGTGPPPQGDDVHPTICSRGPGRLDMFATGADSALWHRWYDAGIDPDNWSDWQYLGGQLVGPPTATAWGPDRVDVAAVGQDGNIWKIAWADDAWSPWQSLGDNP